MRVCDVYHLFKILCIVYLNEDLLALSNHNFRSLDDTSFFEPPINFTYKEIASLLKQHGFDIAENPGGPPLARVGDIIYHPILVLPELVQARGRGATPVTSEKYRWMDKSGKAEVFYFFDSETKPRQDIVQKAIKAWAESTCITFTKMTDGRCSRKTSHGAICIKNEGKFTCESTIGNKFHVTKDNQLLSLGDQCGLWSVTHELGHALGLYHTMSRADRDSFITVNYQNFRIKFDSDVPTEALVKDDWSQAGKCGKGQGYQSSTPLPYDYRSIMHYSEAAFGDDDYRVILATKDPHFQYMLDYTFAARYLMSHYDLWLINTVYKCDKKWATSCGSPPKCKNHGYLQKNCTCACAAGFRGTSCEQKDGPLFPKLDKARAVIESKKDGHFDFKDSGMHTNNYNYPRDNFIYNQYATMYLNGPDKKTIVSVRVFEPGKLLRAKSLEGCSLPSVMNFMSQVDCQQNFRLYWGDYSRGRVRSECFSSVFANEPEPNALVLRSKTNVVGIVMVGRLGQFFKRVQLSKDMMEAIQFRVRFIKRPQSYLKVLQGVGGPEVGPSGDSNETVVSANDTGASKDPLGKGESLTLAIGVSLLLVALAVCCALFWCCSKKSRTPDSSRSTSPSQSNSSNQSSNSNDDSSE